MWYFERAYFACTQVLFFIFTALAKSSTGVERVSRDLSFLVTDWQPDALGMSYVNRISKLLIIKSYLMNPSSLSVCSVKHSKNLQKYGVLFKDAFAEVTQMVAKREGKNHRPQSFLTVCACVHFMKETETVAATSSLPVWWWCGRRSRSN